MRHLDRLSTLVQNFEVQCRRTATVEQSNLWIFGNGEDLTTLHFSASGEDSPCRQRNSETLQAWAFIDIGKGINPLISAFPPIIRVDLRENCDVRAIAELIVREHESPRCGVESVFARLSELLIIHLMRNSIELNETPSGVLAGLAHPKIQKVIVAIHDKPQHDWRLEDFTNIAGMSRSRFMEEFQAVMAETPMAYLKRWRLSLAESALRDGIRLSEIARRYGFGGTESFSRSFTRHYGMPPSQFRRNLASEEHA